LKGSNVVVMLYHRRIRSHTYHVRSYDEAGKLPDLSMIFYVQPRPKPSSVHALSDVVLVEGVQYGEIILRDVIDLSLSSSERGR
jgi:hypothetical protein